MLRIIAGLLLLWTPYCGFSHALDNTIQNAPADVNSNAGDIGAHSEADVIHSSLSVDAVTLPQQTFALLSSEIPPAHAVRLAWQPQQSLDGLHLPTPVLVVNGARTGPVLCLTAAIHGDELNGIEIVRRIMHDLDPDQLSGTVIGVPIVNLQGFHRTSRYLTDRRDLNRNFPGNPYGSSAARIAHSFFMKSSVTAIFSSICIPVPLIEPICRRSGGI